MHLPDVLRRFQIPRPLWIIGLALIAQLALLRVDGVRHALFGLIDTMRAGGPLGFGVYLAVVAVAGALAMPVWIPGVIAAYAFGPVLGSAVAFVGMLVGASSSFVVGRRFLQAVIARRFGQDNNWRKVEIALKKAGIRIVVLLRASPMVPQNVLGFALSATSISYRTYLAGMLGALPSLAMHIYVGSAARNIDELLAGKSNRALLVAGFIASAVALFVIAKVATKVLKEAVSEANESTTFE